MIQNYFPHAAETHHLRERVWVKISEQTWNTILGLVGQDSKGLPPLVSAFNNRDWLLFHRLIEAKRDPEDGQYYLVMAYDRENDSKFSATDSERMDRLECRTLEKKLQNVAPLLSAELDPERGPVLVKHPLPSPPSGEDPGDDPKGPPQSSTPSQKEPVNF